jgi:anti-sigma factor RsiW
MRSNHPFEPPACPEELLEAYLDGELDDPANLRSKTQIEAHLAECSACRDELDLARQVRAALRGLPIEQCPASVVDAVRATALAESETTSTSSPSSRTVQKVVSLAQRKDLATERGRTIARPAFWLAAALLVGGVATIQLLDRTRPSPTLEPTVAHQVSREEVAQAERDARLALAIFAQLSDRVGDIVQEEVIGRRVSSAPTVALDAMRKRKEKVQ